MESALTNSRKHVQALLQSGIDDLPGRVKEILRQVMVNQMSPMVGKLERLIKMLIAVAAASLVVSIIAFLFSIHW